MGHGAAKACAAWISIENARVRDLEKGALPLAKRVTCNYSATVWHSGSCSALFWPKDVRYSRLPDMFV